LTQAATAGRCERPQTKVLSNTPASTGISNRYNKLLEKPVTCTKHTPPPSSNRYKQPLFVSAPRAISYTSEALIEAQPKLPYAKIPNGSRTSTETSNRYNKLLELLVTHRKHKPRPNSNRYKQPRLVLSPRPSINARHYKLNVWENGLFGSQACPVKPFRNVTVALIVETFEM